MIGSIGLRWKLDRCAPEHATRRVLVRQRRDNRHFRSQADGIPVARDALRPDLGEKIKDTVDCSRCDLRRQRALAEDAEPEQGRQSEGKPVRDLSPGVGGGDVLHVRVPNPCELDARQTAEHIGHATSLQIRHASEGDPNRRQGQSGIERLGHPDLKDWGSPITGQVAASHACTIPCTSQVRSGSPV
jgi:hypothetical protein